MSTVTFSRGFRMWQPPFRVTHSTRVNAATHRLTRASDARGSSICTKQASVKNVEFHHVRTSIQATAGRICCHTSRSFAEATLLLSAYSLMFFTFCIMFCIHIPDDGVEERCKISNVVPPQPLVYSLNHVSCAITNTSSNFYAPQNSTLVLDCLLCAALSQQRNQENEYNGESQTCSWWWCSMLSSHSRNRTNPWTLLWPSHTGLAAYFWRRHLCWEGHTFGPACWYHFQQWKMVGSPLQLFLWEFHPLLTPLETELVKYLHRWLTASFSCCGAVALSTPLDLCLQIQMLFLLPLLFLVCLFLVLVCTVGRLPFNVFDVLPHI